MKPNYERSSFRNQVKNLGYITKFGALVNFWAKKLALKSLALSRLFGAKWFCPNCITGVYNDVTWHLISLYQDTHMVKSVVYWYIFFILPLTHKTPIRHDLWLWYFDFFIEPNRRFNNLIIVIIFHHRH